MQVEVAELVLFIIIVVVAVFIDDIMEVLKLLW